MQAIGSAEVVLVSMPWGVLETPSIQLGVLTPLVRAAGLTVQPMSLFVDVIAYLDAALGGTLTLVDYRRLGELGATGIPEWTFAVPPLREPTSEADARFAKIARDIGIPDELWTKVLAIRDAMPGFLAASADRILAIGPRVVGFTTTFGQTTPSLALARLLQERDPTIRIVVGGANCDGVMGATLAQQFPWIDVVVRGEAEAIAGSLFRALVDGKPVPRLPGLCIRKPSRVDVVPESGGGVAMSTTPRPEYDEYFDALARAPFQAVLERTVNLTYESSRGCWWGEKHHCTFCGLNGSTMVFRSKDPEVVVEDLRELSRRHGVLSYQITDNILDMSYLKTVLPALRALGFDLDLFFETKANLKRDQLAIMKGAGINSIQPGIESLSTPILRLIDKGTTALQNIRLLKWCKELGIDVRWNIISGFPREPVEEYQAMTQLLPRLHHLTPPRFSSLALERFSPYYDEPAERGIVIRGPRAHYRELYPTLDDASLANLAYAFEYVHADGRDPETYVGPLRDAVNVWNTRHAQSPAPELAYRVGPGFVQIRDTRDIEVRRDYVLEGSQADIYLACDTGTTADAIHRDLPSDEREERTIDDVQGFLDELVTLGFAYEEGGRYLALACRDRHVRAIDENAQ